MDEGDRFLTLAQAAERLQVSIRTLQFWIYDGKIPTTCYTRPGRKYIFSRKALEEWVRSEGDGHG